MQSKIPAIRWDAVAGATLIVLAGVFLMGSWHLPLGTLRHMGPGFFPFWSAVIMAGLGVLIIVDDFRNAGERPSLPKLRPFVVVVATPLIFGLLIGWLGLVPTVIATALVARFAEPVHWGWDLVLVPCGLAILAVLVFIEFIGVTIPMF